MIQIDVIEPGWSTTVQDAGRPGLRRYGIPQSGAMDMQSMRMANARAGNPPDFPVLEGVVEGGRYRFLDEARVGMAGPGLLVEVNGTPVDHQWELELRPGDVLQIRSRPPGLYLYFSLRGKLQAEQWLGSYSTYLPGHRGGIQGRRLQRGDKLVWEHFGAIPSISQKGKEVIHQEGDLLSLRISPGPEWPWFGSVAREAFLSQVFTISTQTDRMGMRLEAPFGLSHRFPALRSSATFPGVIQWPPGGRPIVLLQDGQTTGGYPRIATVANEDLYWLVHGRPGDQVKFAVKFP